MSNRQQSPPGMLCPDCEETHADWTKHGEHAVCDGIHTGYHERWACGHCGAILVGTKR